MKYLMTIFFLTSFSLSCYSEDLLPTRKSSLETIKKLYSEGFSFYAIKYSYPKIESKKEIKQKTIFIDEYFSFRKKGFKKLNEIQTYRDFLNYNEKTTEDAPSIVNIITLHEMARIKDYMVVVKKDQLVDVIRDNSVTKITSLFAILNQMPKKPTRKSGFNFVTLGLKGIIHPVGNQYTPTIGIMPSWEVIENKLWLNNYIGGFILSDVSGNAIGVEALIGVSYFAFQLIELSINSGLFYIKFKGLSSSALKHSLTLIYPFKTKFLIFSHLMASYGQSKIKESSIQDISLAFRLSF